MALMIPTSFQHVRGLTKSVLTQLPESITDQIPDGCSNNLRWLAGHILFAGEGLLLRLAGEAMELPAAWGNYFSRNTSPSDFDAETPAWGTILAAIEPSTERLLAELDRLDPAQRLPEPWRPASAPLVIETRGEALALATWHEALHVGQMMTYRNLLGARS